jgi:hypothetical protein
MRRARARQKVVARPAVRSNQISAVCIPEQTHCRSPQSRFENRLDPPGSQETAEECLAEIAEILATGLMRLRARKSSGLLPGEADFSLEILARQSGAVGEIEGDTQ